jgi:hypothetical protein
VGIIFGSGFIYIFAAVFFLVYMAFSAWTGKPLYEPGPAPGFTRASLLLTAGSSLCGAYLIYTAVQWARGRWRLALVLLAALILLAQFLQATGVLRA